MILTLINAGDERIVKIESCNPIYLFVKLFKNLFIHDLD
jgi:hypothetical protein